MGIRSGSAIRITRGVPQTRPLESSIITAEKKIPKRFFERQSMNYFSRPTPDSKTPGLKNATQDARRTDWLFFSPLSDFLLALEKYSEQHASTVLFQGERTKTQSGGARHRRHAWFDISEHGQSYRFNLVEHAQPMALFFVGSPLERTMEFSIQQGDGPLTRENTLFQINQRSRPGLATDSNASSNSFFGRNMENSAEDRVYHLANDFYAWFSQTDPQERMTKILDAMRRSDRGIGD
jgi:hypothetical protein